MRKSFLAASFATAVIAASHPAMAADAEAVANRIEAVLQDQGMEIEIGSASADGDDIILNEVRIGDDDDTFEYDRIRLEDVTEADGYYRIASAELPARETALDDGWTATLSPILMGDIQIATEDRPDDPTRMQVDSFQMESMTASVPEGEVLRVDGIRASDLAYEEGTVSNPSFSISRFSFDTQIMPDESGPQQAAAKRQLAELGYARIEGDAELTGRYDPDEAKLTFAERITIDNALTLKMDGEISDITPERIRQIQIASQKIGVGDDDAQEKLAQEELLPIYSEFVLDNLSVRIEDASLTEKLIQIAAERQNAEPEQIKMQAAMFAPAILAAYVPAELAQQVGTALQTYLNDPQSLTIGVDPQEGSKIGKIVSTGKSDPNALPALLNPTISANQGE